MEMTWVWTGMVTLSLVFGLLSGNLDAVSAAALEGARSAIEPVSYTHLTLPTRK